MENLLDYHLLTIHMVAGDFTLKSVHTFLVCTHIYSTGDQELKIYLSVTEQKRQYCECCSLLFFNPLKVKLNLK